MPSPYGARLALLFNDIEATLSLQLNLTQPFQPEPTAPGQRFGICDFAAWDSATNEQNQTEQIKATILLTGAYENYKACRDGSLQLVADLRSLLPSLNSKLDRHGVLLNLNYPRSVPAIKSAPIKSPNTSQQHLWIVNVVVPITLDVAIGKSMCGEHI
jgi:hypothetical protein